MEEIKVPQNNAYFADLTINFISELLESGFGYMTGFGHLGINKRTADNGKCLPSAAFFFFIFYF